MCDQLGCNKNILAACVRADCDALLCFDHFNSSASCNEHLSSEQRSFSDMPVLVPEVPVLESIAAKNP